jgi:hypothetical protein
VSEVIDYRNCILIIDFSRQPASAMITGRKLSTVQNDDEEMETESEDRRSDDDNEESLTVGKPPRKKGRQDKKKAKADNAAQMRRGRGRPAKPKVKTSGPATVEVSLPAAKATGKRKREVSNHR